MLDNHIDSETPADRSIERAPTVKPKTKYTPSPKIDVIASYDYVKRKDVQVVAVRPPREYSVGSVPGSKTFLTIWFWMAKKLKLRLCLEPSSPI